MPHFTNIIAAKLIRWRWALLSIAVVLAIVCVGPAMRLDFDRTLVSMFAEDDPLMPPYRRLQELFGDNGIVLAVYDDPGFFAADAAGIQRLIKIRQRLAQVPGVHSTFALDSMLTEDERLVNSGSGVGQRLRRLFEGFTHGADRRTVCVACMLTPEASAGEGRDEVIAGLRDVIEDLPDGLSPGVVTGEPAMMADAFAYIEQDGHRLFIASTVLLGLVILLVFRSIRWVIIPIAVVQLALLITKALLTVCDIRLTMVSSVLTAIVTVIGVATVVHVIVRFRAARLSGMNPLRALLFSARLLVAPVTWACVTDAVGFAALTAASVQPVRNFGIMMAVGSLCVLVSAGLLIPGLALAGRLGMDPQRAWGEGWLDRQLKLWSRWVAQRPWQVATLAIAVSGSAIWGVQWLEVETDFTRNFRDNTPIVRSYEVVENKLGGAGLFEVILPVPEAGIDWKYLVTVLNLENRLRKEVRVPSDSRDEPSSGRSDKTTEEDENKDNDENNSDENKKDENKRDGDEDVPALTNVISVADVIYRAAPTNLAKVRRRLTRQVMINAGMETMRTRLPELLEITYTAEADVPASERALRIMLRARERQPAAQKQQIIDQVVAIVNDEIEKGRFPSAEVTGFFVLLTNLVASVVRDQWRTFAIALIGIGVTMVLAFRSIRFALVALVPNGIPILMVMGFMGWLGLRINMGAAMIAAVSVGLSVDSSIHYITAFRRELAAHRDVLAALSVVQDSVGRAVVFSTLALVVGFGVLCTSRLIPIVYFGVLVSISMIGGLLGNLFVLPLLLRIVTPTPLTKPKPAVAATAEAHTG